MNLVPSVAETAEKKDYRANYLSNCAIFPIN